MRHWRPKSSTWFNRRWITSNWGRAPTRPPRLLTGVCQNSSWWRQTLSHWRSCCICPCCARTRTCRTFSYAPSRPWAARAACRAPSSRALSPSTKDLSSSLKSRTFSKKSKSCWSRCKYYIKYKDPVIQSILYLCCLGSANLWHSSLFFCLCILFLWIKFKF